MDDTTTASKLRALRGTRSRAKVAAELGISERTLIRHEDGTTPLNTFHRNAYANYYGVPVESLQDEVAA